MTRTGGRDYWGGVARILRDAPRPSWSSKRTRTRYLLNASFIAMLNTTFGGRREAVISIFQMIEPHSATAEGSGRSRALSVQQACRQGLLVGNTRVRDACQK